MMKKLTLLMMMFLTAGAVMAQGIAFEPDGTTLEQASAKAKAENKLIFLDAFTTWCGPCKMMARTVFPQEQVGAAMNPKFVSVKIDMESPYGAPLAKKLQITAFPTFVIFNADAQEIGRFMGGSSAEEFLKRVEEKSKDNASADLQARWKAGDRDPQFLFQYLKSLSATYKMQEAGEVAEAILDGKEETFAADSTLRSIFIRNIQNPFAKSFVYTAKNPEVLAAYIGRGNVDAKIASVFTNYQRDLLVETADSVYLNQEVYDRFAALLKELNVKGGNQYLYGAQIQAAEKQKNWQAYLKYIQAYLADPTLDAGDMQLARWARPFSSPAADAELKATFRSILVQRIEDIKAGKRQASRQVGNMRLSRPTDELLQMIVNAFDGKMPNQQK
ncbi:thioredoxin family protein [Xylanibacter brevis]|uniref:thioredoxin family protein n=1 Tax=Xylanibacter brevis TaxID=83231 RepID=UPI000488E701|nr:thioredoxin family protein [Xylanibacter brevis]